MRLLGYINDLSKMKGLTPRQMSTILNLIGALTISLICLLKPLANGPLRRLLGYQETSGRSSGKKVRLTPSQVAIAKKLGVPLEEYAKYVKE